MITNEMLVQFCEAALKKKSLYMWGTYGKLITSSLIATKAKQYPKNYSQTRREFLLSHADGKTVGCDCAGLIKWALWTNCDINGKIKYDANTDRGTTGLYNAATQKGPMAVFPGTPGLIVYKKGHVGVYVGNGYVIECTLGNRGDGIVKTKLEAGAWTYWLKLPEITYIQPAVIPPKKRVSLFDRLRLLFK
jgi:cell wall-associated NlpC family hydrolase